MIKIIVDGQSLRWYDRAPKVAADSVEFVKFKFLLSEEWDDHVVVAQFSQKGATYNKVLEDGCCTLPVEIEDGKCFISIFGQIPGGPERATVIPLLTDVSLSGFVGNGKTSIPPTPDLYSQLIDYFSKNSSGGAGAVDPEDIAQAVEDYLTEHPIKESYSTTTEITDESTNEEVPTAAAVRTYVSQHFGSSTELFIVTVRRNTSGATADKTSKEVYEAYTQGKIPYCRLIDVVADLVLDMPFTGGGDVLCYFANTIGGLNYFVSIQDATAAVTVTELLASDKLTEAVEDALTQAKESGEFDGDDYVLTEDDKLEIAEQVSKLSGGNVDLSGDLKTALINYYTHVMPNFDDANGLAYINAILTALGAETRTEPETEEPDTPAEPDEPEVTLSSISATYSGGDVPVGTAVSALTGIVVTAHYSDGSSSTVTGYSLSGNIAEGSNTVTVSYGGKTATFTVTGAAESGGETESNVVAMTTGVQHTYATKCGWYSDGGNTVYTSDGRFPGGNVFTSLSEKVFESDTEVKIAFTPSGNTFQCWLFCSTLLDAERILKQTDTEDMFFYCKSSSEVFAYGWSEDAHEFTYTVKAGYKLGIIAASASTVDGFTVEVL